MTRVLLAWVTLFAVFLSAMPCEDLVLAVPTEDVQSSNLAGSDHGNEKDEPCPDDRDEDSCPDECACLCCPGHATIDFTPRIILSARDALPFESPLPLATVPTLAIVRPSFRPPRRLWTSRAIPARAGPTPRAEKRSICPIWGLAPFRGTDEGYGEETTSADSTRSCGAHAVPSGSRSGAIS